ncbi:MAG: hypothetical protein WCJ02_07850 [bacterium]
MYKSIRQLLAYTVVMFPLIQAARSARWSIQIRKMPANRKRVMFGT